MLIDKMDTEALERSAFALSTRTTPEPSSNTPSSPLLPARDQQSVVNGKPKKKPTVTPRTFTRFFTPRSSIGRGGKIGASRKALRDITALAQNRNICSRRRTLFAITNCVPLPATKDGIQIFTDQDEPLPESGRKKRRKTIQSPETTPDLSSPLKGIRGFPKQLEVDDGFELEEENDEEDNRLEKTTSEKPKGIRYGMRQGPIGRMLGRELGTVNHGPKPDVDYAWGGK